MMTHHRFQLFAIAFGISSLLSAGAAQAQRAAMAAARRLSAVRARPVSTSAVTTARAGNRNSGVASIGAHSRVSANGFFLGGGLFPSVGNLLNPYPPPGFDFGFLSAMNQDLGIKAVIDPETEWRLAVAEQVLRSTGFVGSGYYLLDGGGAYAVPVESTEGEQPPQQPPAQQPPVIVVQGAPAAAQTAAAPQPAPEESAPLPDVGQFVLVLRNGTQIQAVAFTRKNDYLVYITTDGLRRTLALADLDSDSTIRINEERGTPLQLPL